MSNKCAASLRTYRPNIGTLYFYADGGLAERRRDHALGEVDAEHGAEHDAADGFGHAEEGLLHGPTEPRTDWSSPKIAFLDKSAVFYRVCGNIPFAVSEIQKGASEYLLENT